MEQKRLYRDEKKGKIGGVCQGLGDYFGIDPTIVRLIFLLLLLIPGRFPIVLVYIVLWVVLPDKRDVARVMREEDVVVEMRQAKEAEDEETDED